MERLTTMLAACGLLFGTSLACMSLAAGVLIVWRWLLNIQARRIPPGFLDILYKHLEQRELQAARDLSKQTQGGAIIRLYQVALHYAQDGLPTVRREMENEIQLEILPDLNFLLPWLLTLSKVATMIGLLGTVAGMIEAFSKIAGSGESGVNPKDLASDIGLALVTTAWGLLIAIPLILAHSSFRQTLKRIERDLQRHAQQCLHWLRPLAGQTMQR